MRRPADRSRAGSLALARIRAGLDALLPASCVVCRRGVDPGGPPICGLCQSRFPRVPLPMCPRCSAPIGRRSSAFGAGPAARSIPPVCSACRRWPGELVTCRCPFVYRGSAAAVVRSLKYGRWRSVVPVMVEAMEPSGADVARAFGSDGEAVVVPVPLSPSRLRERGFNQARELAEGAASALGLSTVPLLGRGPGGPRQAGAGIARRQENVQGSFFLARPPDPAVRSAIIVDDVLTTGATILACVDVLREAGLDRIGALTFARTLRAQRAPDHG